MLAYRLLKLIKNLEKQEITRFRKYLKSPFFTHSKKLPILFEEISGRTKLEDTMLFNKVYRGEKYRSTQRQKNKLNQLKTELLKHLENFLIVIHSQKIADDSYSLNQRLALLEIYARKQLSKKFWQHFNEHQQLLNERRNKDEAFFEAQYKLYEYAYRFGITENQKKVDHYLEKMLYYEDCYYILKKLLNYCGIMAQENIFNHKYDFFFPEQLFDNKKDKFLEVPVIAAYYHLVQLNKTGEEQYFIELKNILLEQHTNLSDFDVRQLYNGAINYCSRRIKEGKKRYFNYLFDLYYQAIPEYILHAEEHLSPFHYTHYVKAGLEIGKFEIIKEFMQKYREDLKEQFKETYSLYNCAVWYFFKQDYEKVLDRLNELDNNSALDIHIKFYSKKLRAQTYYLKKQDTQDIGYICSVLENFRRWVRENQEISDKYRKLYKPFADYILRLYKIKEPKKDIDRQHKLMELKQNIQQAPVYEKHWLLNKIEKLNQMCLAQ